MSSLDSLLPHLYAGYVTRWSAGRWAILRELAEGRNPRYGFADWLMFGGKLIGHNDPDYQEKVVKFNELIANCVMYSTACDITAAANEIAAEGEPVDLATISPYITSTIRRFGSWTLNLTPPDRAPVTRLDLEPRVLFAPPAGK